MAEPIEMQFEMWTLVGLRNQVWPLLDGRSRSPHAKGKRYLHGKWLTERARTTVLLQRNPSFRKTTDQVHFGCRKLCRKVTK